MKRKITGYDRTALTLAPLSVDEALDALPKTPRPPSETSKKRTKKRKER